MILGRTTVLHVLGTEFLGTEIAHAAAEVAHATEMSAAKTTTEVAAAKAAARIRIGSDTKNAE